MAASGTTSKSDPGLGLTSTDPAESLWDVDYDKADQRIGARRSRIRNRIDMARKIKKMIHVKHIFGYHSSDTKETFPVEAQCDASRALIENVLDNGSELVTNVRLAADHLQVQHRERHETRFNTLKSLLAKEDLETNDETSIIQKSWPGSEIKKRAPMELYEKIMEQKRACNDILQKRDDMISILEDEIKDTDNQYKMLIEEYHENTSVLASRMEAQIQALEGLVRSERKHLVEAYKNQKVDHLKRNDRSWQVKNEAINRTATEQIEERLKTLRDQEEELDDIIVTDSEAFVDMKHKMEENIASLTDQIQLLDAVHQMNEERLDYEIHVLRKHEEEIVLVKSEQKRKITVLQDTINKLRRKVRGTNDQIAKEESNLHDNIANIRSQLDKLHNKKRAYGVFTNRKKAEIAAMVRDEVQKDVERIVDTDFRLQKLYMTSKPKRLEVFDDDFLKELNTFQVQETSAREGGIGTNTIGATSSRSRHLSDKSVSSVASDLDETELKKMLSSLVHQANFLVEDNLSLLVEEIPEDERNLFKLDSILTAIGLQGEKAVFKVLKQHEKNPSKAMDSILKVIRNQIEARKREKEQNVIAAGVGSLSTSSRGGAYGAGISSTGKTEDGQTTQYSGAANEWLLVEGKLAQFKSEERIRLLTALKNYNEALMERATLLDKNSRLSRHNAELKMLLNLDNN